jgi:formate hydrogenlyase transcriptional activator
MKNILGNPSLFLETFGQLSAKFVSTSLDNIDEEIIAAQRLICQTTGIDRCSLWQFSEDHDSLIATHIWADDGLKIAPNLLLSEMFPWFGAMINRGETVRIPSLDTLPPEASKDLESFKALKTKSNLTIPLCINKSVFGCIAFGVTRGTRVWTDDEVRLLELMAQVFSNVLDRKSKGRALHESQRRLALASRSAGIGFWGVERGTKNLWATEIARELFSFPADARLTTDEFNAAIHPEDRARALGEIQRQFRSGGGGGHVDFRVQHPDGRPRWVSVRGSQAPDSSSGPLELTGIVVDISERKRSEEELRNSLEEIKRLKDLLYAETDFLKAELVHFHSHPEIVGKSKAVGNVLRQIRQVAGTSSTVLITGETGTGKELVARAVHALSDRRDRVMVKVDCASLPSGLIESELFGRERGAYTGALAKQVGRFQLADKSTIFLDEIGELPLEVQAKLLRILESGEFEPLGSPKTVKVNVRIIAATNRDLDKAMREGRFREDLYYRLKVFPIEVPPLRERIEDIPLLAYNFIRKFSADMGKNVRNVRKQTMLGLQQYAWPGNVRELRNLIEHALITTTGDTLNLELPAGNAARSPGTPLGTLAQTEELHIRAVLEKTGWRIKGKSGAAELLGVKPSTLYAKMKKLGVPSRRQKVDMGT